MDIWVPGAGCNKAVNRQNKPGKDDRLYGDSKMSKKDKKKAFKLKNIIY
jgi:hypothetical protein